MRTLLISAAFVGFTVPSFAQSAEATAKAIDCLALTQLANDNRSFPDTAQVREWQTTVETSPHCKQADQGVAFRVEEYRTALREADPTRRFALELMIESEAEKCVSGADTSSLERGA
ncbi:MAG: hypothetical protein AAGJ85_06460 [Pseudomonadota bacterium]